MPDYGDCRGELHRQADLRAFLKDGMLFRGQAVDKPLLPKLARIATERSIPYRELVSIEREMLERFRRESLPLLSGFRPGDTWEWLILAQHHGLPTRLLDWTTNAQAAVWFAVAVDIERDKYGVVYSLQVTPEQRQSSKETDDVFNLRRTFVFPPPHIDRRVVAQSAWFSVHAYSEEHGAFVPLDKDPGFRGLEKHAVPGYFFEGWRTELRSSGVTRASLFPDLAGLCGEIQAHALGTLPAL